MMWLEYLQRVQDTYLHYKIIKEMWDTLNIVTTPQFSPELGVTEY
jgi:hypothetical protein